MVIAAAELLPFAGLGAEDRVDFQQEGRLGLLDRPEEGGVGDVRGRQRLADQRREDIEQ